MKTLVYDGLYHEEFVHTPGEDPVRSGEPFKVSEERFQELVDQGLPVVSEAEYRRRQKSKPAESEAPQSEGQQGEAAGR